MATWPHTPKLREMKSLRLYSFIPNASRLLLYLLLSSNALAGFVLNRWICAIADTLYHWLSLAQDVFRYLCYSSCLHQFLRHWLASGGQRTTRRKQVSD